MKIKKLAAPFENMTTWSLWYKQVLSRWHIYFWGCLAVLTTNLIEVALPKLLQFIIDHLDGRTLSIGEYSLQELFIGYFVLLCFLAIMRYFWRITLARESHWAASTLKSSLWDRIRFFPQDRLDRDMNPGHLMNVATSDVNSGRFAFGWSFLGTSNAIFLGTLCILAMLSINVEITLWSVSLFLVVPFFVHKLVKKHRREYKESQESLSELNEITSQSISTIRLQRMSQTGDFWYRQLLKAAESFRVKRLESVKTALQFILYLGTSPLISYSILFAIGLKYLMAESMSIGEFVAMINYIFILQEPLEEVGFLIAEWQKSFGSLDRLKGAYTVQQDPLLIQNGSDQIKNEKLIFKIEKLHFRYPEKEVSILENLELEIQKGDRLGIKGPIGSGKSSFLRLICGLESEFEGNILLFGQDIRNYSHLFLRDKICMVPQKPFLFADSIRNNLSLGKELKDKQIWHYLEIAELKEDVEKFPEGLATQLGEWGINLSGGQKQRLTLARALAQEAEILLLDDCLSAVDTVTEEKILINLNRELKDKSLVWVAHRESTLKYCNKVMEFH